jgi:hypothetical protein
MSPQQLLAMSPHPALQQEGVLPPLLRLLLPLLLPPQLLHPQLWHDGVHDLPIEQNVSQFGVLLPPPPLEGAMSQTLPLYPERQSH